MYVETEKIYRIFQSNFTDKSSGKNYSRMVLINSTNNTIDFDLQVDTNEYSDSSNLTLSIILLIVLPTIAGLIFLILVILLIVCLYKRYNRKGKSVPLDGNENPPRQFYDPSMEKENLETVDLNK